MANNTSITTAFLIIMVMFSLVTVVRIHQIPKAWDSVQELFHNRASLASMGAILVTLCVIRFSSMWKNPRWKKAFQSAIVAVIIAFYAAIDFVFAPFWFVLLTVYYTGEE